MSVGVLVTAGVGLEVVAPGQDGGVSGGEEEEEEEEELGVGFEGEAIVESGNVKVSVMGAGVGGEGEGKRWWRLWGGVGGIF